MNTNEQIYNEIKSSLKHGEITKEGNSISSIAQSFFQENQKVGDNKKRVVVLIGSAGTGKTHILINKIHQIDHSIINCNNIDFADSTQLNIDGWNEISDANKVKIIEQIKQSTNLKNIFITSWHYIPEFLEDNEIFEVRNLNFSGSNSPQSIAKEYGLILPMDVTHFFSLLTFRQLHYIFQNVDQKTLNKNSKDDKLYWDHLQKVFENLINNLPNIKKDKKYKNLWEEFKIKFIVDNPTFPYIDFNIDPQWSIELEKFFIIQKNARKGYMINNSFFLMPVYLRDFIGEIKNDNFSFLSKISLNDELFAILIYLSFALKKFPLLKELINKYGHEYNSSVYANTFYNFYNKIDAKLTSEWKLEEINWEYIKFDKYFSLIYLAKFIDFDKLIEILVNKEGIFFGDHEPFTHTYEEISYDNDYDSKKKVLISVFNIFYSQYSESISRLIMPLINRMRYITKDFPRVISINKQPQNQVERIIIAMIAVFLKEWDIELETKCKTLDTITNEIFIPSLSNGIKDFSDFEDIVYKFNEDFFNENSIDKKEFYRKIDDFAYRNDKSVILEHTSSSISKISNKKYSWDKYKNDFLAPLLSFTYINLFKEQAITKYRTSFFSGMSYIDPKAISYLWRFMIDMVCGIKLTSYLYDETQPYIKDFVSFKPEIANHLEEVKEIIKKPFFLNDISGKEILKKLIYEKDDEVWYPIHLFIQYENECRNLIMRQLGNNPSIQDKYIENSNSWFWIGEFPGYPTNSNYMFSNYNNFIAHEDPSKNEYIMYTKQEEILDRFYEFYFDSLKIKRITTSPSKEDYLDLHLFFNFKKEIIVDSEQYRNEFKGNAESEWEKYATDYDIKKMNE